MTTTSSLWFTRDSLPSAAPRPSSLLESVRTCSRLSTSTPLLLCLQCGESLGHSSDEVALHRSFASPNAPHPLLQIRRHLHCQSDAEAECAPKRARVEDAIAAAQRLGDALTSEDHWNTRAEGEKRGWYTEIALLSENAEDGNGEGLAVSEWPQWLVDYVQQILGRTSQAVADQASAFVFKRQVCPHAIELSTSPTPDLDSINSLSIPFPAQDSAQGDSASNLSDGPVCSVDGCDLRSNLWVCLHCGAVACGRAQWDGSGGNGHAMMHWKDSQAAGCGHGLALSLGSCDGLNLEDADVYCYACDDECAGGEWLETVLLQRLRLPALSLLRKRESSLLEREWTQNQRTSDLAAAAAAMDERLAAALVGTGGPDHQKSVRVVPIMPEVGVPRLKEDSGMSPTPSSDSILTVPATSADTLGLRNLGNSCYQSAVLQAIIQFPRVRDALVAAWRRRMPVRTLDAVADVAVQVGKLAEALHSPNPEIVAAHAHPWDAHQIGLSMHFCKQAVCAGNSEFLGGGQHDAGEYLHWLLDRLDEGANGDGDGERESASDGESQSVADGFRMSMCVRVQCNKCGGVSYRTETDTVLGLPVSETTGPDQGSEVVVGLAESLAAATAPETVADFRCPAHPSERGVGTATVTRRPVRESAPEVLVLQARRYAYDPAAGDIRKLPIVLDVPSEIDIAEYTLPVDRCQPAGDETALPDDADDVAAQTTTTNAAAAASTANDAVDCAEVTALTEMGFEAAVARVAVQHCGGAGCGAETAMAYLLDNLDTVTAAAAAGAAATPSTVATPSAAPSATSSASVEALTAMGFTPGQARTALRHCSGAVDRAVEWLFDHPDAPEDPPESSAPAAPAQSKAANSRPIVRAGAGTRYRLEAIVSHLGRSTASGHYVAHRRCPTAEPESTPESQDSAPLTWRLYNDEKVAACSDAAVPIGMAYLYFWKRIDDDGAHA